MRLPEGRSAGRQFPATLSLPLRRELGDGGSHDAEAWRAERGVFGVPLGMDPLVSRGDRGGGGRGSRILRQKHSSPRHGSSAQDRRRHRDGLAVGRLGHRLRPEAAVREDRTHRADRRLPAPGRRRTSTWPSAATRCKHPPTANFTKDEDYVSIGFDPFGSKTTGYFFQVFGSGLFWDGLILDDGRDTDLTWEGVWSRAVRDLPGPDGSGDEDSLQDHPVQAGADGVGAAVPPAHRRQLRGRLLDRGHAEGRRPRVALGHGPRRQSASRPDTTSSSIPRASSATTTTAGKKAKTKPKGSLNLKWDLTSQTSLNATAYPDFAQIESDPFSVNLSRYPTYLEEQRPFFVEGREIFRFSSFPNSGFFQPLNIFYSRRIGKSVDGEDGSDHRRRQAHPQDRGLEPGRARRLHRLHTYESEAEGIHRTAAEVRRAPGEPQVLRQLRRRGLLGSGDDPPGRTTTTTPSGPRRRSAAVRARCSSRGR